MIFKVKKKRLFGSPRWKICLKLKRTQIKREDNLSEWKSEVPTAHGGERNWYAKWDKSRLCPPQLQHGKHKFDHHLRIDSLAEQIFDYRISNQIDDKVIKITNWNLFLLAIYYCIIAKKLMQFLKHIFQLLY